MQRNVFLSPEFASKRDEMRLEHTQGVITNVEQQKSAL
jgi:hypothetical protein